MSREMLLFINNTSTTEIYTYGHTLSLHDALTILLRIEFQLIESLLQQVKAAVDVADGENSAHIREIVPFVKSARSEEHTSELQSLMRISYAVFCLNKKKCNIIHLLILPLSFDLIT